MRALSYHLANPVKPTNADYRCTNNTVDGVIIINSAYSPMEMLRMDTAKYPDGKVPDNMMPVTRYLSSFIYRDWASLHQESHRRQLAADRSFADFVPKGDFVRFTRESKPFINWILVQAVPRGCSTHAMILRCLESRGHTKGDFPDFEHRETFQNGHW